MKRTYFLSYALWNGRMNIGHCRSFEATTDAEARAKAADLLPASAHYSRLRCVTDRWVKL